MFAKVVSHKSVSRFLVTLIIALGLVVPTGFLSVGKASAWSAGTKLNSPGDVIVDPQLDLGDVGQPTGVFFSVWGDGPIVRRSPFSTGTQTVGVQEILEQYIAPNWVQVGATQLQSGQIVAGGFYQAQFQSFKFSMNLTAYGYFRVKYIIIWSDAWGHSAGMEVIQNQASDYICSFSRYRPCETTAGYFHIGLYGTNRWY